MTTYLHDLLEKYTDGPPAWLATDAHPNGPTAEEWAHIVMRCVMLEYALEADPDDELIHGRKGVPVPTGKLDALTGEWIE